MSQIRRLILIIMGLFAGIAAQAQDVPVCPADVLLAVARSGSACFGLERGYACLGNGTVTTTVFPGTSPHLAPFEQSGDRRDIRFIESLAVQPMETGLSTALLDTQANLTDAEERGVFLLLFGDAVLDNLVPPPLELTGYARGVLNIRQTPDINGDLAARLAINQAVTANGRTKTGDWLRVRLPDSNELGWAAAEVVALQGSLLELPVVEVGAPVYRSFQVMKLATGAPAACGGALASGLLLQTPNTFTFAELTINGVVLRLAGTFFLQAADSLTLHVLDGQAEVTAQAAAVFIPAGAFTTILLNAAGLADSAPAEAAPYLLSDLRALPLNILPARVQAAAPATGADIARKRAEFYAVKLETTSEPVAPGADTTCRRLVRRDTTVWAGPGEFYEAVNDIEAGTPVEPVLQTTDPDGAVWWQLADSSWLLAGQALETGACEAVPVTTRAQPPRTNTLSLETCATTNGPLRVGQQVTIEFVPQAFDNYGEARDALKIDPGTIRINDRAYRASASEPMVIGSAGGERYLRRFYLVWTATAGTHRIEGDRLHYLPSCTVTVPVG